MIPGSAIFLLLCGVIASMWLLAERRRYAERKYEVLFKLSQHHRTILGFQHRTDLTGSYAQLVIMLAGLATLGRRKIYMPPIDDYALDAFERQGIDYGMVSSVQTKNDHLKNNAVCIDKLGLSGLCVNALPRNVYRVNSDDWRSVSFALISRRPLLLDIGSDTNALKKIIVRGAGGMDSVFNSEVRSKLYSGYLKTNLTKVPSSHSNRKLKVCIHARHGEICDMPNRFIPSTEYVQLLSDLRDVAPDADIHLYSARWCDGDSPEVFRERGVKMHIDDTGVFETWDRFMHADILVISRSSFSYAPALIKNEGVVLYRKFWHPAPGDWIEWDETGILQKEELRNILVERISSPASLSQ